ncbi:MAG: ParB/RepB/Spo0J family partition protein, partial [Bacteroidota bacterium]
EVNPFQPRNEFDEEALQELSESIGVHGLIQPITVRRLNPKAYQLISGERRLRASKRAGLAEIPAYIRVANDQEMLEMALVENIQREQLNAIEVAITYQRLLEECKLTHESLADRVGKKRTTITNHLRLLKLPPDIQNAIKEKSISMGHARELAGIEDFALRKALFLDTIKNGWSVRRLEEECRKYKEPRKKTAKPAASSLPQEYKKVEQNFKSFFGSGSIKLKLKSDGKGQIVIPFTSVDQLNEFLDRIEE